MASRSVAKLRFQGHIRRLQDRGLILVRPITMTFFAILMGFLPIMWSSGTGSDVMKRIAAPMVGGIVTTAILSLLIYPAIYVLWKRWTEVRYAREPLTSGRPTPQPSGE